jgi:hypothetical protein
MNGVLTIRERAQSARQTCTLIEAAAHGALKTDVLKTDVLRAIAEAAKRAAEELYWIGLADQSKTPAPTDDERAEVLRETGADDGPN